MLAMASQMSSQLRPRSGIRAATTAAVAFRGPGPDQQQQQQQQQDDRRTSEFLASASSAAAPVGLAGRSWAGYLAALQRRPLLTKAATSFVLTVVSGWAAGRVLLEAPYVSQTNSLRPCRSAIPSPKRSARRRPSASCAPAGWGCLGCQSALSAATTGTAGWIAPSSQTAQSRWWRWPRRWRWTRASSRPSCSPYSCSTSSSWRGGPTLVSSISRLAGSSQPQQHWKGLLRTALALLVSPSG